jgi:hypothetical protein
MFVPLQNYFQTATKCPVTIRQFFDDVSGLFWLKFVDSQLSLSNEYVLKTESKTIASFEVAAEVTKLRSVVENRMQNNYLPADAEECFVDLSHDKQNEIKKSTEMFYSELNDYLTKWSRTLDGTEVFSWMRLTSVPDWNQDVKPSVKFVQQHFGLDVMKVDAMFDETLILKQFVTEYFTAWNENKASSQSRWIEIFKNLSQKNRPIKQISLLVQYAFAIPGTSTEVERLFSIINDVWGPEKGQMKLSTLEAHLNVKINSNKDCVEYYASIKDDKKLLAQVQSGEKYKSAEATQSTSFALSTMQDFDDDD